MEGLTDCHSKLLYTIYKLHRQTRISDEAKVTLKAKVIKDEQGVMQVYHSFLQHDNVDLMEEELIEQLGKPARKRPIPIGLQVPVRSSPEGLEDASPLGNFLRRRKKEHEDDHQDASTSFMRPMQVMEDS
jgi:hypothetical protein